MAPLFRMKTLVSLFLSTTCILLASAYVYLCSCIGVMPPDEAFVQVTDYAAADRIVSFHREMNHYASIVCALSAFLGALVVLPGILTHRRGEKVRLRKSYRFFMGLILVAGALLLGIKAYCLLQGIPEVCKPVAPWINTYWGHKLQILHIRGLLFGIVCTGMAAANILLYYLRFSEHLHDWRQNLRRLWTW